MALHEVSTMPGRRLRFIAAAGFAAAVLYAVIGCRAQEAAPRVPPAPVPGPPPVEAQELEWGLLVGLEGRLVFISATGDAAPRTLATFPPDQTWFNVAVAPDHHKLALVTADRALMVIDLETGVEAELSPGFEGTEDDRGDMAWAPDSRRLAHVERYDIHVADADGLAERITSAGGVTHLAWSPDGSMIAYGRRDDMEQDLGLWVIEAAGGTPRRVVPGGETVFAASFPAWAPDGKTLAFAHAWEGGALCFVRPDGSGARLDIGPAWGPFVWLEDASAVMYDAAGSEVESEGVFMCGPDNEPQMLLDVQAVSLDILPTGDLLVLETAAAGEDEPTTRVRLTALRNAARGGSETLHREFEGAYGRCMWRPDGEGFAVFVGMMEGPGEVYVGQVGADMKPALLTNAAVELVGWARAAPATLEASQ